MLLAIFILIHVCSWLFIFLPFLNYFKKTENLMLLNCLSIWLLLSVNCCTRISHCDIYMLRINFHFLKLHEKRWCFDLLISCITLEDFLISYQNITRLMLLTEHSSVRPKTSSSGKWKMIVLNIPRPLNENRKEVDARPRRIESFFPNSKYSSSSFFGSYI